MDHHEWDVRYGGDELVWSSTPNQFLVTEVGELPPGRALDLACGEGRNAVWLAEQGWEVTGVDFSSVGLTKASRIAEARGVKVNWVQSDVLKWRAPAEGYDLVAMFYLQLGPAARTQALGLAASAVAPGGTLVVVAHDADNLTDGVGGPQDLEVLYRADEVVDVLRAAGLEIERAGRVIRNVVTDGGTRDAIDTLVRASRPKRARAGAA
jgi:SAM-dependent methyltransferase